MKFTASEAFNYASGVSNNAVDRSVVLLLL